MSGAPDPLQVLSGPAAADAPPPALLPYQQRWVADQAPLKVAEKSRRIGLTWAEAADDVLIASQAEPKGANVFYISATQDMALEYIEAVAMWARAFDAAAAQIEEGVFDDGEREIKTYRVDFPRAGHRIVALSSRPANLRGKQGVIVIDEAAFAPDLQGLLKAAMAMLMWGDRVRVISTHNGEASPFNDLVQEIRAGRRAGSVHRITFTQAVEEGLYRRVCLRKRIAYSATAEAEWVRSVRGYYADDAAEELDVIPSAGSGTYLTMALIEARMSPATPLVRGRWPSEFALLPAHLREAEIRAWCEEELAPALRELDPELPHALGGDFGRLGDLSVDVILAEGKDLVSRCRLVVELSNCPFEQQRQILFYIGERLPRFRAAALDATGNGAYLAEVAAQRFGSRVEQVKLSDAFYLDHWPRCRAALQDETLTGLPRDAQIRDDLRAVRLIDGVPKLPRASTQVADGPKLQRHGDAAIALLLAHYAIKREAVPMEFRTPGRPRASTYMADYLL